MNHQFSDVRPHRNLWPLVLLLAAVAAGLGVWRFWPAGRGGTALHDPNAAPREVTPRGDLYMDEQAFINLFKEASKSVVNITTVAVQRDLVTLNVYEIPRGTGSGFVWDDEKGYVVTNYHVVEDAVNGSQQEVRVTLDDNTTWKAKYVGGAPDVDLAVLQIEAPREKLRKIPVGSSRDLQVGQRVFAIGNPFGLDQSLTMGIISAVGREIKSVTGRPIKGVIQIDAAINPGNSGGPLLDSAGRLIGVNTAIASPTGAYAGIGFAIPVDMVNRVVPQIIAKGRISRPGLGVQIADDSVARRLRVRDGVLVMDVIADGPAAKAGFRPTRRDRQGRYQLGDVIVAINDQPIAAAGDLYEQLAKHQVGDTVKVVILRDGQRQTILIMLQEV